MPRWTRLLTIVLILSLVGAEAIAAQNDDEATCDATLVTLLLVAMRDYDYQPPMRLDFYDFADYRPLVEQIGGVTLTANDTGAEISAGEQAQQMLNDAAAQLSQDGLPALGEGLAGISDEVAGIVNAGQEALQAGQEAISAGAAVLGNRLDSSDTLMLGALPNESAACTLLRTDLIAFFGQQLNTATAQ